MIALGIMIFGFAFIILLAWQFVLKHITRLPGIGYALKFRWSMGQRLTYLCTFHTKTDNGYLERETILKLKAGLVVS
jgi:hypothetical protein